MRHLFVCTNTIASGKPACGGRGGVAVLAAVQQRLVARHATDTLATACACLGTCFDGPNAIVYGDGEDGVWYGGLDANDADALVDHLVDGKVLAAKVVPRPGR